MISKEKAMEKLNQQILAISELKKTVYLSPEFRKWQRDTQVLIEKIFGEGNRHTKDFDNIYFSPLFGTVLNYPVDHREQEYYQRGLNHAKSILQSFIDEVNNYWDDKNINNCGDSLSIVERICNRFHRIVKQLKNRHDDRSIFEVNDEL